MKDSHYGIATEGWPFVLLFAAFAAWLLLGSAPWAALVPVLLLAFVLLKFRDPDREVVADPLGVISPVDGLVVDIDRSNAHMRMVLRIAMFSPYLVRSPVEGRVVDGNGGHGVHLRTDEGAEVTLRLHCPRWLPPSAAIDLGERVGQGQRFGLLRGARAAELLLPADTAPEVAVGAQVRAGETVLARLTS